MIKPKKVIAIIITDFEFVLPIYYSYNEACLEIYVCMYIYKVYDVSFINAMPRFIKNAISDY